MKQTIRKNALERRAAIPAEERTLKSDKITGFVLNLPETAAAKIITVYVDYRNEVQTRVLIQRLLDMGKTVALPVADFSTCTLTFTAITTLNCLVETSKRLWEPDPCIGPEIPAEELDLILTPGAAFDRQGYRLGYGGGFYDRLLERRRPGVPAIGLAFSEQLIDALPTEAHDQKLDGIVTDAGVLRF